MEADPLYYIKQLFYQGSYKECISEARAQNHLPGTDALAATRACYIARANLAQQPARVQDAQSVLDPFVAEEPTAAVRAVAAFAALLSAIQAGMGVGEGERATSLDALRDLTLELEGAEDPDEGTVRAVAGSAFVLEEEYDEAIATLSEGAGKEDMECIAVLVQVLLILNRRDLATALYNSAKKSDSALVGVIEAWIGLQSDARARRQAFYFYDELYNLPTGRTVPVLASRAAAHVLLGQDDEAKADIVEARRLDGGSQNSDVLNVAATLGDEAAIKALPAFDAMAHEFDRAAAAFTVS